MTNMPIQPWIRVNEYMNDQYRRNVVFDALEHWKRATPELSQKAKIVLGHIRVPGFSAIQKAPAGVACKKVVDVFKKSSAVAFIIISLWAEGHSEMIDDLRNQAQQAGIRFRADWSWKEARIGYVLYEDMPEFHEFLGTFLTDREKPAYDHYMLAALWLSGGLVSIEDGEPASLTDETELLDELPADDIEEEEIQTPSNLPLVGTTIIAVAEEDRISAPDPSRQIDEDPPVDKGAVQIETEIREPSEPGQAVIAEIKEVDGTKGVDLLDTSTANQLADLVVLIEGQQQAATRAQNETAAIIQGLSEAVADNNPGDASRLTGILENALVEWEEKQATLYRLVDTAQNQLVTEFETRPDLERSADDGGEKLPRVEETISSKTVAALQAIAAVLDYDRCRELAQARLSCIRTEILEGRRRLLSWSNGKAPEGPEFVSDPDEMRMTLARVNNLVVQAEQEIGAINTQLLTFRNQSKQHIIELIELIETSPQSISGGEADGNKGNTIAVDTISIDDFTDEDLLATEFELMAALQKIIDGSHAGRIMELATILAGGWDEANFVALLDGLAAERRDIEVFLLEVFASRAFPRSNPTEYPHRVVTSLMDGLNQVSTGDSPFQVLSLIAPSFLSSFKADTEAIQAEICMIALAAHHSSGHVPPAGYLWQVSPEWPVPGMPNWARLWQSTLLNKPAPIYTDQKEADLTARLAVCRKQVEQDFARDGAHFTRLSSIKNNHHQALMNNRLMPGLWEKFDQLKRLDSQLRLTRQDQLTDGIRSLTKTWKEQIFPELEEPALIRQYDTGASEETVIDPIPFHRRVSVRILQDCAENIIKYGDVLVEYWELSESRSCGLISDKLAAEMATLIPSSALGKMAFEQMLQERSGEREILEESQTTRLFAEWMLKGVLTNAYFSTRFPRLVGTLCDRYMGWNEILDKALADLSEPVHPEQAVEILIEMNAPSQAMLISQYLTPERQNVLEENSRDFERQYNDQLTELVQLGGDIGDIEIWHGLGRWGYVFGRISADIDRLRKVREKSVQDIRAKAIEIRRQINTLDEELFLLMPEISPDTFQVIERAMATARRATDMDRLYPQIEEFIQEMIYFKEHNSWQREGLVESMIVLERAMEGTQEKSAISISAEQLLKCLSENRLSEVMLSQDLISASEIATRIELLRNWLFVKKSPGSFKGEDGKNPTGLKTIQDLFRYFAQMMVMKKCREEGREKIFTTEIVCEHWRLQFPRTDALNKECVLIALPGDPVPIPDIKLLQEFIEDKEFLPDYFVFLFVPSVDEKIARRFQAIGAGKGLVLIDEKALTRMILAESKASTPLGRLRPMMLEAKGANSRIFVTNSSVNPQTAIFVGRDRLIDRIVNSGKNHCVFGGRRIGKSSLLGAIKQRLLRQQNVKVVSWTLDGDADLTDEGVSLKLAEEIGLTDVIKGDSEFKQSLHKYMEDHPDLTMVIMLDEIDWYVRTNKERHTVIEALRSTSDIYSNRFWVIIAGFLELYDCLCGRGPYAKTSSGPWQRMFVDNKPLDNLTPANAENIVKEGFQSILGWEFESRTIPHLIVAKTGGHPAFVQKFCEKLYERVGPRTPHVVRTADIDAVFKDNDPISSFIAFVRETFRMNVDTLGRYLVVMLAALPEDSQKFSWDDILDIGETSRVPITEEQLKRSLELLTVNSVICPISDHEYQYTVPDYPKILERLGDTKQTEELEREIRQELGVS